MYFKKTAIILTSCILLIFFGYYIFDQWYYRSDSKLTSLGQVLLKNEKSQYHFYNSHLDQGTDILFYKFFMKCPMTCEDFDELVKKYGLVKKDGNAQMISGVIDLNDNPKRKDISWWDLESYYKKTQDYSYFSQSNIEYEVYLKWCDGSVYFLQQTNMTNQHPNH